MGYQDAIKEIDNNKIAKVYLLHGEEIYLRNLFIKKLQNKIINQDFEDLNLHSIENKNYTLEKLIDACETLPFMSEKKLLLVRDLEFFQSKKRNLSEKEEKGLIEYIEKIPDTICLVFYGFTSVDARKKIVKEIKKHGRVIDFKKLNIRELRQWIDNRFKAYNKKMDNKCMEYFLENIDYVGKNSTQNLLDIEHELEKVISFIGDRNRVEIEDFKSVLSSSFQNDIFKLLDAIEKKQANEAMKRLNHMLNQGEPLMRISATLGNHIRNLIKVKLLLEDGYSSKLIASKLGMHPFVVLNCARQSRGFTMVELKNLLKLFLEMDIATKTGRMKDTIAIELFVLQCITAI